MACLASARPASARDDVGARLDALLDSAELASALAAVEVRDAATGAVVYSRAAEKSFEPASVLKLVTTAAALDALGPDARFRTTLESAARIDAAGRLLGDLYLVGGGEPNLSGRFHDGDALAPFRALARQLRAAGVRRVEGRLLGHDGLFRGDRRPEGWDWEDLVWWYGAEVSALSFNDNAADLSAAPGDAVGAPLRVGAFPATAYYQVVSRAVTSPAGGEPELKLQRELGSNRILLSGSYPLRARPWRGRVALEDPARYAATVLREQLEAEGIAVAGAAGAASLPLPEARRTLAAYEGPPLRLALRAINKESLNLHAELLLRHLGVGGATAPQADALEAGRAAVAVFLERLGVDVDGWHLQDGSGLSQANLVTARGLAQLLVAMRAHPSSEAFRDSLPVSGVDGTLEHRLGGRLRGRIRAKTGTLRHVAALAGYATPASGGELAFVVMLNHHVAETGWRAADRLAAALVR